MVLLVQIGIDGGFSFQEVVIGFVFDSQSMDFSSLISRGFFVSMEVPRFVVAQEDTKVGIFVELMELVRLMVGVFAHYSNKDLMIAQDLAPYPRVEVSMGDFEI